MAKVTHDLDERLAPLVKILAPLRIVVTCKVAGDKYYLHFNGIVTYSNVGDWDKYWISFEDYIVQTLRTHNIVDRKVIARGKGTLVVFIGTLFDFLK
jgi:hypothetical protein